jgi:signal transduction histidine kinase/ActR/RegA family two-component response regulator
MAIQSIADYLADGNGGADGDFVARSQSLQDNFGGFQALNWVAPDGTIEVVVPREANSGALGKSLLNHPIAGDPFLDARRTGEPQLTAPLELFQGGRGVATYMPVGRNEVTIGYLNAVFRMQQLVERSLGAGMLDSHTLSIVDGKSSLYQSPNVTSSLGRPSGIATVTVLNRNWTLVARPDDKLWAEMRAGRPRWIFLLALLLAIGACWLLRGAMLRTWREEGERRHRQQLELELERSAKMQALGRLAGGVAHDFNNILTAIIGNAEIIKLTASNPVAEESAKDIVAASERAGDLTRQLLVFSNQRVDTVVSVDLNSEIEELRGLLTRLLSENIALEFHLADSLASVLSNRGQISQILVNLAVNAADAMPDGGRLRISTEMKKMSQTPDEDTPWVVLSVADSGVGMDSETQARIFEPFFSTKGETHKGAGLGLATVYGIVQALGGELRVESEQGVGTAFEMWLPSSSDAPSPSKGQSDVAIDAGPSRHILFVEDNSNVRNAIVKTLRHHGHIVRAANDGEEALETVANDGGGPFDVIVTDAVMPGISGPEMIRTLRSRKHTLPIIICSGYSEELAEPAAVAELGAQFLPKPYAIDDLIGLIRDVTADSAASTQTSVPVAL